MADTFNENILPEEEESYADEDEYMIDEDMTGVKGGSTERTSGDLDDMDDTAVGADEEQEYEDYSDDM